MFVGNLVDLDETTIAAMMPFIWYNMRNSTCTKGELQFISYMPVPAQAERTFLLCCQPHRSGRTTNEEMNLEIAVSSSIHRHANVTKIVEME